MEEIFVVKGFYCRFKTTIETVFLNLCSPLIIKKMLHMSIVESVFQKLKRKQITHISVYSQGNLKK